MKKFHLESFIFSFLFLSGFTLRGQDISVPISEAIKVIETKGQYKFFYRYDWIKEIKVNSKDIQKSLVDFLKESLADSSIDYVIYQDYSVILFPKLTSTIETKSQSKESGIKYILNGKITEANSGDELVGSTVLIPELSLGTTSNSSGFYSLSIPKGTYTLVVSSIGMASESIRIEVSEHKTINFELFDQAVELSDVVVKGESDRNVTSVEMSLVKLDSKAMSLLPKFMGETDIIKTITLLPGVSTVGEGSSGFNVRGGNVDQNLVLLDDVPVFNTSHLFGFMTSFNPDIVDGVTLYKAGIPAQYGGRISSVLDVKIRESDSKKIIAKGGLGILSSKLLIEGPIIKDKTTFIIGGRYGYPDWILKKIPDKNIRHSAASFYDANAIVKHTINNKNSLHFSSYYSSDKFKLASDTLYNYSTFNSSLRYKSLITKEIFFSITGQATDYTYSIDGEAPTVGFQSQYGVNTKSGKIDFTVFSLRNNKIDIGLQSTFFRFKPGNLLPDQASSLNSISLQMERAIESALYMSDEVVLTNALSLQAGLRYSQYSKIGPYQTYLYKEGISKSLATVLDTVTTYKNKMVKTYHAFEPRLSFKLALGHNNSIKLSYNRSAQYVHLISNTTAVSPLDIWKSSDYNIAPQIGQQLAAGYYQNFKQNTYEITAELYYKRIEGMLEYKNGASLFLNSHIETEVLPAQGKMYGSEFLLRKNQGRLTGWFSYAYSRSFRKAAGLNRQEAINNGQYYPSNFDRPHNFSIVINHKLTKRLSFSTNFIYNSGRPITYPQSIFIQDGYVVTQYSERNSGRILAYHRLDLSLNIEQSLRKSQKWKGSWSFSIYNVYGRKNQYSVFFKPTYSGKLPQSYQLAVLGSVLPSITYNFNF